MIHAPILPAAVLSKRQRALISYFRRIGNAFVPAAVVLGIVTTLWIAGSTISAIGKTARPMSAAVEARAQ